LREFRRALESADLVVAAGQASLTDHCRIFAFGLLEALDEALRRGRPAVLLGQGVGPMTDPDLRRRAAEVLPRASLIALRESLYGPGVLQELSVPAERTLVTGDDAIEAAYESAPQRLGTELGVNVRVMPSAGVDLEMLEPLAKILRETAVRHRASLVPLPIAMDHDRTDARHLVSLLPEAVNGGREPLDPAGVIRRAERCRVVVTGAYHAAVFALAQGIPVVGIARSDYFRQKFEGLAHEFGPGCVILDPARPGFYSSASDTVADVWGRAERLRPELLAAARRQVEAGHEAWRRLEASANSYGATA
jgi:colanic acid/amylovoran biosynthesis protein